VSGEAENSNENKGFSLKEWLGITILGTITFGGSFLIGRKMIRNARTNNEQNKTDSDGNDDTLAKQIKMAFHNDGWPGTDIVSLRASLTQVPSQQDWEKVKKAYQKLYNTSLLADMQHLDSTQYQEMISILSAKPDKPGDNVDMSVRYVQWAKRINAAFTNTYGPISVTDRDALKAVLYEIPTQADYIKTGSAYSDQFHNSLDSDLKSNLHFWEVSDYQSIISSKPIA
jgi:hypothetical protein